MSIPQRLQSGLSHHQAGRLAEAEAIYLHILSEQPDQADALHLLGVLLGQIGKPEAGKLKIRRALELRPDYSEALSNLGNLLAGSGEYPEALACHGRAVQVRPDIAAAHVHLGNTFLAMRRLDEAVAAYRQAIAMKPDFAEAMVNLGIALRNQRQLEASIKSFRNAIALQPNHAIAHGNLAAALAEDGQFTRSVSEFAKALALNPDDATTHSNLIFLQMFLPEFDSTMIRQELARWNDRHAKPLQKLIQPHANDRTANRRLRIGYVSADFRDHVIGRNVLPLLSQHDRAQFEVFCYSNVSLADRLTVEFQKYADGWRDIRSCSNEEAAEVIRRDRIDILVDLSLHTSNHRLLVFALRPAPVQVTFAGYPGSTGLEAIDYRLTDPFLDPPDGVDEFRVEKPVRLPKSFWCYEPGIELPVNSLPADANSHVTFGCLNNFTKVNDGVVRLWSQVMRAVESSRMLLLCPEGAARERLLALFEREKVDRRRIEFAANCPRPKYLELYHRIDVGLDTFPYNGHTTSLDSYWMGVPVVTLVGSRIVGRAGISQLSNLGLPELIARTADEYVRIATSLAADLPRLAAIRASLRQRMERSPLMDAAGFARGIEAAYREMWVAYCSSE
jgi:protein O-GlcNAc transferase